MPKKISVVGAGVMGVGSALRILQTVPDVEVTLISDKFSPETTGDGAAGFIMPYALGDSADVKAIRKWYVETIEFLKGIALSEDGGRLGVAILDFYNIAKEPVIASEYDDLLVLHQALSEKQLSLFPPEYKFGFFGTTIYAQSKRMLPVLMSRFQDLGGKVVKKHVSKLQELVCSSDVIVNCTGIGAFHIAEDTSMYPIRGQVIRVKAPWIKYAVFTDQFHVLPSTDVIQLGGTKQVNNWSTEVDPNDKERIWKGCCSLVPSIKNAEYVEDWVGLRPGRPSVRLERDRIQDKGREIEVIHNYGHGGSGVTLFWGCAGQVVSLLQDYLKERT